MTDNNNDHKELSTDGEELARKLADITMDYDPNTIFRALLEVFAFWMSTLCKNCRKDIAHNLKRAVPRMLAEANRAAAMKPSAEERHLH